MSARVKVPGRGWARTGAILGGLVSIAANVAHSFIAPADAPATWHPSPGAIAFSMAWPVLLYVAVEVFSKPAWPRTGAYALLRWAGLLPVALVAGFVSYRHMSGLLLHYGEEPLVAFAGPIAVDGLMVMATAALMVIARIRQGMPLVTKPAVIVDGSSAASRQEASPTAAAKLELPHTTAPAFTPAVLAQRITPRPTPPVVASAAPSKSGPNTATRPKPSKKANPPASRPAPSAIDTSVTAPDRARTSSPVVTPELLSRVRIEADKYRTEHGTPISPGQLAVRLRVTSEQAQQALAVLNLSPNSPVMPAKSVNGTPPINPRKEPVT
jgi:hypothetical protein